MGETCWVVRSRIRSLGGSGMGDAPNSEDSSTLNTSFIERLNLTIRQGSAYLSRRTLSHARSQAKLEEHLELRRCHYNFVRPHSALKFGRETRTPAMQAGHHLGSLQGNSQTSPDGITLRRFRCHVLVHDKSTVVHLRSSF